MNFRTQKFIAALAASGKTDVFPSADCCCTKRLPNYVPNYVREMHLN
jgi:hypothetical protein